MRFAPKLALSTLPILLLIPVLSWYIETASEPVIQESLLAADSGDSANAPIDRIRDCGLPVGSMGFLQKLFCPDLFVSSIREVLDGS